MVTAYSRIGLFVTLFLTTCVH